MKKKINREILLLLALGLMVILCNKAQAQKKGKPDTIVDKVYIGYMDLTTRVDTIWKRIPCPGGIKDSCLSMTPTNSAPPNNGQLKWIYGYMQRVQDKVGYYDTFGKPWDRELKIVFVLK